MKPKLSVDAIKALCKRPKPPPEDTSDLIPVAKPTLANVEELGKTPTGTKARDWAAARVREVGGEVADADDLKALKAKFVVCARERALAHPSYAAHRVRALLRKTSALADDAALPGPAIEGAGAIMMRTAGGGKVVAGLIDGKNAPPPGTVDLLSRLGQVDIS